MATGYWVGATNTSWSGASSGARWRNALVGGTALSDATVPGTAPTTDIASFNNSGLTAVRTVYLNGEKTVLGLAFTTYNRGTTLAGGASGAPAGQRINLGTSGINSSTDSTYYFVTDANTIIALTIAATPFTIPSTNASYISGPITGTGFGINKQSGGHLVFNGAGKTYTGATRVSGGVLFLDTTMSIPSAGAQALRVDSGAACVIRATQVYGTASNNYEWVVNGECVADTGNQTFPATVFMSGGIMRGGSTDTLGAYCVRTGTNAQVFGYGSITTSVGIQTGATLRLTATTGQTISVSGSGVLGASAASTGSVVFEGSGAIALLTANVYTGGTSTNTNTGIVSIGNNAAFGTGTLTLGGGSLQPSDTTSRAIQNNIVVTGSTTSNLFTGSNFADLLFYGTGSGSGTVVVNSSVDRSTWLQGNWSGFTGTVQHESITNGMLLRLGGTPGSQSSNTSTNGSFFQQAKFVLSGTGTNRGVVWCGNPGTAVQIGELSGTGGRLDVGSPATSQANWQVGALNTDSTYAGTINGTNSLTKVGTGKLTLTGASDFSGGTTLSAGTLSLGNDSALGTGTLTISSSSTLDVTTARTITNAMSIGSSFTFAGTNTLTQNTGGIALTTSPTITVSGAALTLNGIVSGTGRALTKAGSGTLTLSAANTYDGGTTLSAGTLVLGNNTALGSGGTFTIDGNSTLDVTATRTLARPLNIASSFTFGGTDNLTTNGGVTVSSASTVTVNGFGRLTFATGGHSYTQRLTKAGTGTLRVGSGSGAGGITLSDGTLEIDGITTPLGTGDFIVNAGVIDALTSNRTIQNAMIINGDFTFTGTRNLTQQTGAVSLAFTPQIFVLDSTLSINGVVSGAGYGISKWSAGTLTLGAANTFDGGVLIANGTLKAANQQALGTGSVQVAGATLAALASIGGKLNIGGTLTNSGGTLRIGGT